MKINSIFIGLAISISLLRADTFVLHSGESLEGKILSEDEDTYLLEIRVTPSIKDEKRVKKSDIKEIIEVSEEEIAFNSLKPHIAAADLSTEKEYVEKIGKLSKFVVKFPDSEHTDFVNKAIAKLQTELESIKQGAIKLNGLIIPQSGIIANQYDIDASIQLKTLRRLHLANSNHDILKAWERFYPEYFYSSSMEEAAPIMISSLRRYRATLEQLKATLPTRITRRKQAMERLSEEDELRTIEAFREREALFKTIHQQERENGRIWLTLDDFSSNVINFNLQQTEAVLKKLLGFDSARTTNAGLIYRNAWSAVVSGDVSTAESSISDLAKLRIPAKYTNILSDKLAEKKEELEIATAKAQAEKDRKKSLNPDKSTDDIEEKTPDELFSEDNPKKEGTFNRLRNRKKELENLDID